MQQPLPLEYIARLIQGNYIDEARRGLNGILEADPHNAGAWALVAWIAPDADQCVVALQAVADQSQDPRLVSWARRGLLLVEHTGTLDEEFPPLFAPPPSTAPAKVVKEKKPAFTAGQPGFYLSQSGGGVMIFGILILILAILSQGFADLVLSTGVSPGLCGMGLVAIGATLAFFGYQRRNA